MKIDWNKKYNTISVYTFLVVSAIILFYNFITGIDSVKIKLNGFISIMMPFIIGFTIAYLLDFILRFYEIKVFSYKPFKSFLEKFNCKRGLGLVFTYLTALACVFLFIQFVLPQLVDSIFGLVNDVPAYVESATKFINETINGLNLDPYYMTMISEKINDLVEFLIKASANLIPMIGNLITGLLSSVWNVVLGLIVSIYLLIEKEKFFALGKKVTYAIFSESIAKRILELTDRSNNTFGKFLSGKILDSFIIWVITFVILTIVKMPYAVLISVIIGITNIIPFFGPFIGAVPAVIIVLFVSPQKALLLVVIIFIIQQLDGNIIGPKILGDSIGISAFWILFSILVTGKLLGLVGMIIGVPLFAVIYSVIKEIVEEKLKKKGLDPDTKSYL
ncbi:AI-2E family transporter [Clostridium sp. LY3-2]|uniref:AI-2E family transporter n=1 Tax=Clostridium sp. LY3-2 TaxID=2942482 RepID=UPI0021529A68|nr:AI-2E family transporter [Clostridium sp. LY3-2]MCR6515561.1 AI-2E family transporter [Clostridium sp. LY3-2]